MKKRKFRSLDLHAKTLINTFISGTHASCLHDSIIDVDATRDYQPGDKRIDSKSSLRTSRVMARVFNPDKSMTVMLLLDISSSIASKFEQSIILSLYLTYLAEIANDQVGLITFSDKVHRYVEPSCDCRSVVDVVEKLYDNNELFGYTNIEKVLELTGDLSFTNTLIVIVSDFCYEITDHAVVLARRANADYSTKTIGLVLVNESEWLVTQRQFSVNFIDSESSDMASCNLRYNNRHQENIYQWINNTKQRLWQAKIEPVVMLVDRENYIMPLVKYILR